MKFSPFMIGSSKTNVTVHGLVTFLCFGRFRSVENDLIICFQNKIMIKIDCRYKWVESAFSYLEEKNTGQ